MQEAEMTYNFFSIKEIVKITRSAILMRPSRRESCLMLSRWNWIRSAQVSVSGSSKCLILSLYTSRARILCGVSKRIFSQRWEPMKPPAPIMHIVFGFIGLPSRSNLTPAAAISVYNKQVIVNLLLFFPREKCCLAVVETNVRRECR